MWSWKQKTTNWVAEPKKRKTKSKSVFWFGKKRNKSLEQLQTKTVVKQQVLLTKSTFSKKEGYFCGLLRNCRWNKNFSCRSKISVNLGLKQKKDKAKKNLGEHQHGTRENWFRKKERDLAWAKWTSFVLSQPNPQSTTWKWKKLLVSFIYQHAQTKALLLSQTKQRKRKTNGQCDWTETTIWFGSKPGLAFKKEKNSRNHDCVGLCKIGELLLDHKVTVPWPHLLSFLSLALLSKTFSLFCLFDFLILIQSTFKILKNVTVVSSDDNINLDYLL